jgi:hypothetical protein
MPGMNSMLFVLVTPPLDDSAANTRWSTVTSDVEGNETSRHGVEILSPMDQIGGLIAGLIAAGGASAVPVELLTELA